MICVICRGAEVVDGLTLVTFVRGEFKLVVNSVPARLCPSCGEAYVETMIAERLLHIAKQTVEAGILDMQCEYSTP